MFKLVLWVWSVARGVSLHLQEHYCSFCFAKMHLHNHPQGGKFPPTTPDWVESPVLRKYMLIGCICKLTHKPRSWPCLSHLICLCKHFQTCIFFSSQLLPPLGFFCLSTLKNFKSLNLCICMQFPLYAQFNNANKHWIGALQFKGIKLAKFDGKLKQSW